MRTITNLDFGPQLGPRARSPSPLAGEGGRERSERPGEGSSHKKEPLTRLARIRGLATLSRKGRGCPSPLLLTCQLPPV
jgi:hypothetical protein